MEFNFSEELEKHLKTHQLKSESINLHLTCGNYYSRLFIFIIINKCLDLLLQFLKMAYVTYT